MPYSSLLSSDSKRVWACEARTSAKKREASYTDVSPFPKSIVYEMIRLLLRTFIAWELSEVEHLTLSSPLDLRIASEHHWECTHLREFVNGIVHRATLCIIGDFHRNANIIQNRIPTSNLLLNVYVRIQCFFTTHHIERCITNRQDEGINTTEVTNNSLLSLVGTSNLILSYNTIGKSNLKIIPLLEFPSTLSS